MSSAVHARRAPAHTTPVRQSRRPLRRAGLLLLALLGAAGAAAQEPTATVFVPGTFTPIQPFTPLGTFTPIETFTPIRTFTPVLPFTPIPTSTFPGRTVTPTPRPTVTRTARPSPSATRTAPATAGTPTTPTRTRTHPRTATAIPSTSSTPFTGCVGDCNGDGTVVVNELVVGVRIALDPGGLALCRAMDANGDAVVSIDELVRAVSLALTGC